jgi:hypothetical protein
MRRWIPRTIPALLLGVTLPAGVRAQAVTPQPTTPPVVAPGTALPPAVPPGPVAPVRPVPALDGFQAATPYNPTVVGRPVPDPAYNRPNFTLPCNLPNQNLDPLILTKPECLNRLFKRRCTSGCDGCSGGCGTGVAPAVHGGCGAKADAPWSFDVARAVPADADEGIVQVGHEVVVAEDGSGCQTCNDANRRTTRLGWLKEKCACCTHPGSCITCCNTANFILGSSRSFFGESSREFFERPPSPDGKKCCPLDYGLPRKYVPPPGGTVPYMP